MTSEYWQQLTVRLPGPLADAAGDLLESFGAIAVTSAPDDGEDRFDLAEPRMQRFSSARVTGLYPGATGLGPAIAALERVFHPKAGDIEIARFADRDWERAWLEQFRPVEISPKLWVCPSWCDPPVPDAVNLVLDPGLAFGTGTHPTTRLCLAHLAQMDLAGRTVLDFGCGSGILAIAAVLLGARRAFACDVDPRALEATRANAAANGVLDRVDTVEAALMRQRIEARGACADVVVANILADALVALADTLTRALAPEGRLLLSGILERQRATVERAYPALTFTAHPLDEWVLLAT